jgi:GNAT superfamily N-acetyltransferase
VNITITRATPADEPVIRELQAEAIAWLAELGTDQWQPGAPRNPRRDDDRGLTPSIARGEVYLVHDESGEVIGTLTLDDHADPEFWTEADDPDSALYIHRMIVSRNAAGMGTGSAMLAWAERETEARGKRWLRLDAWRANKQLQAYYARNGFQPVRTVALDHRGSGALFQRSTKPANRGITS